MMMMNLDLSMITSHSVTKAPLTGDLRATVSSSVNLITSSTEAVLHLVSKVSSSQR